VSLDGAGPPPFAPNGVRVSAPAGPGRYNVAATVAPDWTFDLRNIEPGRARVNVGGLPDGWTLARVVAAGRDVDDFTADLPAGGMVEVSLFVTNRLTSVSGAVTDSEDKPLADYTVLFFSEDVNRWTLATPVRPDQRGAYKLTSLPPGSYRAIALEYLDDGEDQNPEFLAWARERSVRVELVRGEPITLDLKLVKYEGGI
jgi:hypothetical protein